MGAEGETGEWGAIKGGAEWIKGMGGKKGEGDGVRLENERRRDGASSKSEGTGSIEGSS